MDDRNALFELQHWYASQCNGSWEHQFGIKITTLDNPGWRVEICLSETFLEAKPFVAVHAPPNQQGRWKHEWIEDEKWNAGCDTASLSEVIADFIAWARL